MIHESAKRGLTANPSEGTNRDVFLISAGEGSDILRVRLVHNKDTKMYTTCIVYVDGENVSAEANESLLNPKILVTELMHRIADHINYGEYIYAWGPGLTHPLKYPMGEYTIEAFSRIINAVRSESFSSGYVLRETPIVKHPFSGVTAFPKEYINFIQAWANLPLPWAKV